MKGLLAYSATISGANFLARAAFRRRPLVVSYHGVCADVPDVPDLAGIHLPLMLFKRQLKHLLRHYSPVSLRQFRAALLDGARLPANAVLITFDDGYRNAAQHAFPVLREHGVPFVSFLSPGPIERGEWLWTGKVDWCLGKGQKALQYRKSLKALPRVERELYLRDLTKQVSFPRSDHSLLSW